MSCGSRRAYVTIDTPMHTERLFKEEVLMTYPTEAARKRNSRTLVATVRLARWQLRAAWGLLVMTGIGIVAAVMLVCAVPLYANVAMSAGLRGVLTASPQNTVIVVRSNSLRVSAQYISKVGRHLDQELEKNLGAEPDDSKKEDIRKMFEERKETIIGLIRDRKTMAFIRDKAVITES